jgi:twitching motility protein PilT
VAYIDGVIDLMAKHQADYVTMRTNASVTMHTAKGDVPVSSQTLETGHIRNILKQFAPADMKDKIDQEGTLEFDYPCDKGVLKAEVRHAHDEFLVRLRLGPATAPDATPTPQKPAATPSTTTPASSSAANSNAAAGMVELFREMLQFKASDLHLASNTKPHLRVDGSIKVLPRHDAIPPEKLEELLYGIMPESNRQEFDETNDTDFAFVLDDGERMRSNIFRDNKGIGAVFRHIPSKILSAQQLGLPESILNFCNLRKGLVVVTGPTGSGKSTTLAAMVDHINETRDDHIITIEDPVEFVHHNKKCLVNHREVGTHTKSFKAALRAALREDPDIVLVGEMRDLTTIEIAIETAATGHLVFGTLHTNTAIDTVDRLVDIFPADRQSQIRTMLGEALKGVIAQTLCKKQGGGRVAALEVLKVNRAVANLIREGKTQQMASAMQTGKADGMQELNDALMDLVRTKAVTPDEAYSRAVAQKEMGLLLTRSGFQGNFAGH